MMIKRDKLILIFNFVTLLLLSFFFYEILINESYDFFKISKIISIYTLIILSIIEFSLYKYEQKISYFSLFVILCFIFLYGQCYCIWLFHNLGRNTIFNIVNSTTSIRSLIDVSFYTLFSIICMSIGYIIFLKKMSHSQILNYSKEKIYFKNRESVVFIGWLILIISIIPTLVCCYKDIISMQMYGYTATLIAPTGIDKILNIFKGLFNSSLIMLLISDDRRRNRIYLILITYLGFEMLGGTRIQCFKFLILLITLYFEEHKFQLKQFIISIISMIFIAFIFTFISSSRVTLQSDVVISNSKFVNLLYDVLFECGHTQCLMTIVFKFCPNKVHYQYGMSIIRAFLSLVPNIGFWKLHPSMVTVDTVFSPLYTSKAGLGSSIFATSYWNFGYFGGCIAMGFFGAIIATIINKIYNTNNFSLKFIGYYLLFYIVFLVRGDIEQFGRTFVYYVLFPLFLVLVYDKQMSKEG